MKKDELVLKYKKLIDRDNKFTDEEVLSMAELCSLSFSCDWLDDEKYNLALTYLSLHELAIPELLEENGGSVEDLVNSVTSKKEGDLQINFNNLIKRSDEQAYYTKTLYGIKYLELINAISPFFVSNYLGD